MRKLRNQLSVTITQCPLITTSVIFLLLLFSSQGNADAQDSEVKEVILTTDLEQRTAEKKPENETHHKFGAKGAFSATYRSNLFHIANRRLDDFHIDNTANERFHNMNSPWDMEMKITLFGWWKTKIAKKQYFKIRVKPAFIFYAQNNIAKYIEIPLIADLDISKRDNLAFCVELIPSKFKKNYREDGVGGSGPFLPAYYTQFYSHLNYSHRWSKRWRSELGYSFRIRQFAQTFKNYNQTFHEVLLQSKHRLHKRISLHGAVGLGLATSPKLTEAAHFNVDRSYQNIRMEINTLFNLPRRFEMGLETVYRLRLFTTTEADDDARYQRLDHRPEIHVYGQKGLGEHFAIKLGGGYLNNLTNRNHPNYENDELGYQEFLVSLSLTGKK